MKWMIFLLKGRSTLSLLRCSLKYVFFIHWRNLVEIHRKNLKALRFLLVLIGFSSCVSNAVHLEDQNQALTLIRTAVVNTLGENTLVLENGRVLQSPFFKVGESDKALEDKDSERSFIKVTILGDRRPYTLRIQAPIQAKTEGQFTEIDHDLGLARNYKSKIEKRIQELSKRGRSIVDDFRAF